MQLAPLLTLTVLPFHTWYDTPSLVTDEKLEGSKVVFSTLDREKPLYFKEMSKGVADARGMISLHSLGDSYHEIREQKGDLLAFDLSDVLELSRFNGEEEGIQILSSNESVTVVVKKPLIISASFSFKKKVTVYNYSKLIFVCPFCDNVSIIQGRSRENNVKPFARYYSFNCPFVKKTEGSVYLYRISASWEKSCRQPLPSMPSNLLNYSWLPQIIVSHVVSRKPYSVLRKQFKILYPNL